MDQVLPSNRPYPPIPIAVERPKLGNGRAVETAPISAAWASIMLRLLFETGHFAGIVPARTIQVIIVLVTVFLQSPLLMSLGLVSAEGSVAHDFLQQIGAAAR